MKTRATRDRWWAAARGAGPARLTYEIGLALLVGVIATASTLSSGTVPAVLAVLVAVGTLVLVPLRLVYPAGAFAASAVIGAATGGQNTLVMVVMGIAAGYRMRHLGRTVAAFALGLLCLGGTLLYEHTFDPGSVVFLVAAYLMSAVLPAVVARIVARRRSLVTAMHTRNVQLYDQQAAVARQARERERTRIARDLHDSLGHQLTLISLYTGTLATADDEQREATVGLLRTTSAAAMGELRQILGILHEENGDGQGIAQPLSSLDDLIARARTAGAEVTLSRDGAARPLAPGAAALQQDVSFRPHQKCRRRPRTGTVQNGCKELDNERSGCLTQNRPRGSRVQYGRS